jgi:myo-inositol-1(or 4)-monophosphatase
MHARRLATTTELLCIKTPDSEDAVERLESYAATHDLEMTAVPVGEPITNDHYGDAQETLGVSVGGDGAFLEGIRAFAVRGIPLLGVNTGTLAFLARVQPEEVEGALDEVLRGRATINDRQQLRADAPGLDGATGVNDVMIEPEPPENPVDRKICRLHVFAGEEYVGQYDGSGMAVSTPTGSTGVALSANGPVHYPDDNFTLQVVPLLTHRMGARPLIVSAGTELTVVAEDPAMLTVDGGRFDTRLGGDAVVTITGAPQPAHIVRTSYDDDFLTAISRKLGWGLRGGDDAGPTHRRPAPEPEPDDMLSNALRVAEEAAVGAGEPVHELHGRVESVTTKTDKADVVTDADYQAEHIIATVIENEYPEHGIVSEENVQRRTDSEYTWLVDPLDGTGNFAHGNPNYAISIALLRVGDPVVGVVHAPETGETFTAVEGRGAAENGKPIRTTDRSALGESMLLSGYDPDGSFLRAFYQETRGVRRIGAAALNLCYLASGTADAVWEHDTYSWDVAAGLLIAREAGATVTDQHGDPYALRTGVGEEERTALLGSNGPLHDQLVDHLRQRHAADD